MHTHTSVPCLFLPRLVQTKKMKLLGEYCLNHRAAVTLVSMLDRESACFRTFHKRVSMEVTNGMVLRDFLIKPVQRVTK